jgi:hypothetical protein
MSRRTEMAYKAQSPGKVAPFDSTQGAKVHAVIRGDLPASGRSVQRATLMPVLKENQSGHW